MDELGITYYQREQGELDELVAGKIDDGGIVAVVRGRMEFGPRALGNRSLLGDARNPTMRERMNRDVKGRESFRPFAPAVLLECTSDWFDLDQPSPYMSLVCQVASSHLLPVVKEPANMADRARIPRSTLPACTHVDGSARVQTVDPQIHHDFHRLITVFHERTGCPMVLNTSFNLAGAPIVNSVDEALRASKLGGVDLLVLNSCTVSKDALRGLDVDLVGGGRRG